MTTDQSVYMFGVVLLGLERLGLKDSGRKFAKGVWAQKSQNLGTADCLLDDVLETSMTGTWQQ